MLYLCKAIPEEVLEKGLDKYGSPEDIAKFTAWLRIYGKGQEEKVAGRKMHFAKVLPTKPDLPKRESSSAALDAPKPKAVSFPVHVTFSTPRSLFHQEASDLPSLVSNFQNLGLGPQSSQVPLLPEPLISKTMEAPTFRNEGRLE